MIVDADILIVFMQDVLKLVYIWNLNVVEHRNIMASIWYRILQFFASIFASIFDFCVDFASIFDPKSWSQTKKLELVLFKLKFREPFYLLGFSEISFVFYLGCPDGLEPSYIYLVIL